MSIKMIVAVMDNANVIGINNNLPVSERADLQHFKNITDGNVVVMGRKTMEGLKGPLSNRINIVISKRIYNSISYGNFEKFAYAKQHNGFFICESVEQAMLYAEMQCRDNDRDIFIIGGGQLYVKMYKYVSTLHLTVIEPKVISRYNPENNYVYFEHVSTAIKSRIGFFFHKLLTKADPKFFDTAKVVSRKKVKTANNTLHFIELDNRYYSRTYMGSLHLLLQMATKVANS